MARSRPAPQRRRSWSRAAASTRGPEWPSRRSGSQGALALRGRGDAPPPRRHLHKREDSLGKPLQKNNLGSGSMRVSSRPPMCGRSPSTDSSTPAPLFFFRPAFREIFGPPFHRGVLIVATASAPPSAHFSIAAHATSHFNAVGSELPTSSLFGPRSVRAQNQCPSPYTNRFW
jgi:hypothetical protein